MKILLLSLCTASLFAAEPPKPDPVAQATIAWQAAVIRMLQVQADPVYRAALAQMEATEAALKAAKAEAEKAAKPEDPKK